VIASCLATQKRTAEGVFSPNFSFLLGKEKKSLIKRKEKEKKNSFPREHIGRRGDLGGPGLKR
jgi:hypothetical protein